MSHRRGRLLLDRRHNRGLWDRCNWSLLGSDLAELRAGDLVMLDAHEDECHFDQSSSCMQVSGFSFVLCYIQV